MINLAHKESSVNAIIMKRHDGRLNPSQINYIRSIASHLFVSKDYYIFQAGMPIKCVYVLLSGRIKLLRLSPNGRQIIQWFCFENEFFGLSDFMQYEHHTLYAQASSDCTMLVIPAAEFSQTLLSSPDISLLVIEHLSRKLSTAGDMLLCLSSDSARQKVIKLLLRLASRIGLSTNNGILLDMPLTHQELADMVGLCRQTMTTILNQFKQRGLIEIDGHYVSITNIAGLDNIVD